MQKENVVVLGASDKPERYSFKAMQLLTQKGHRAIGVNPRLDSIAGMECVATLSAAKAKLSTIDTVTMYLSPELSDKMLSEIVAAKPKRVIFNPGSENMTLMQELPKHGIEVEAACTLVLLNTNQY
jgi:predicted CoA-binding protein